MRRLVALCLLPGDRYSLALTSWAWLQAAWHGPPHRIVRKLESFVLMTRLLASYSLDPPAVIEFRCDVTQVIRQTDDSTESSATAVAVCLTVPPPHPLVLLPMDCTIAVSFNHARCDAAALSSIVDLSTVKSLALVATYLETLPDILTCTPQLQTLRVIGSSGAGMPDVAAALRHTPQLHTLWVSESTVGDAGAAALAAALPGEPKLRRLLLAHNRINAAGTTALAAALSATPALESLDLEDNDIDDAGAMAIAAVLRYLPRLQNLDVMNNGIGEAGAGALLAAVQEAQGVE